MQFHIKIRSITLIVFFNICLGCANTNVTQEKLKQLNEKITELNQTINNPESKANKIISEAKNKANSLYSDKIDEANKKATEIIENAKSTFTIEAKKEFNKIIEDANKKAEKIIAEAEIEADKKIIMLVNEAQKVINQNKDKKNLKKNVIKHIQSIKIQDKQKAVFGLYWGATKLEIENLGVNLTDDKIVKDDIYVYKTNSLPKNLKDSDFFILFFHKNSNLQKVIMISKDIDDSLSGFSGRNRYNDLKSLLAKDYTLSESFEYVGRKLYKEFDEFYQCLAYKGCGDWCSFFKNEEGVSVTLELSPVNKGKGYIRISVEGPEWSSILDAKNEKIRLLEDEAL